MVDSPEVKTFIKPVKDEGIATTLSLVFVTTGYLKKLFQLHHSDGGDPKANTQGMVLATLKDVVGGVAHQLGLGIAISEDRRVDDPDRAQAESIRGDAEGGVLAARREFARRRHSEIHRR